MRITLWLALLSLLLAPHAAGDQTPLIAVVYGEYSYQDSPSGEGQGARTFRDTVQEALDRVGVEYARLTDADVEQGALARYRVAIFPYNFIIPETEEEAILRYLDSGGKVFFFYIVPESVAERIGLRYIEHVDGDYQTIKLRARDLQGLPPQVTQASWNINRMEVTAPDARVIGRWYDSQGKRLPDPAVVISPRGAYMSHVLTETDLAAKGRMLLAILGWMYPEVWPAAARHAIANASRRLDEVQARAQKSDLPEARKRDIEARLRRQRQTLRAARFMADAGRCAYAVSVAAEAEKESLLLYGLTSPERLREFRGVWLHDAYGVPGWGWQRSIRELKQHGFNAVIANMLWAGRADYESEVLPVNPKVAEKGDQIAEALRWCKQYGIELHVWKVNYNLANAPADFVDELRREGRLQKNAKGEEVLWLCPSDPRNFALERDSMLEVVRKYDVAGIHFDYIRYPDDQTCYCEGCRHRFEQAVGRKISDWPEAVMSGPLQEKWTQWRRDQITKLVRAVSTEARKIRPGIMISAAVFPYPESLSWVNQDWKEWVDEGLLDFVCPMDYTADADEFERQVTRELEVTAGRIPLYPGIGEFIIKDTRDLLDQMERARRLGADGFTLFCYEHAGPEPSRMDALHASHTAHQTTPPHPAPRVRFDLPPGIPDAPSFTYRSDEKISAGVSLSAEGNYPEPITRASGSVIVETVEGEKMLDAGRVEAPGEPAAVQFSLPPGRYRLAVVGNVTLASGAERGFIVRSLPFETAATK